MKEAKEPPSLYGDRRALTHEVERSFFLRFTNTALIVGGKAESFRMPIVIVHRMAIRLRDRRELVPFL